jgi:tetratricopeptide (TPR) repeat protein
MSWGKTIFLTACVCGTICLLGILGYFSLKNQIKQQGVKQPEASIKPPSLKGASNAPASNTRAAAAPDRPAESVTAPRIIASPNPATTRSQLLAQGRSYGTNGEWKKGFECFKQCMDSGSLAEGDLQLAAAIALAAGETNACEQFCEQYMKAYRTSSNVGAAERISKECFSLPHCSEELFDQAMERIDWCLSKGKDDWRQLSKGMGEYRRKDWASSLVWLRETIATNRLESSLVAWCYSAMANHQLGNAREARQALEQANLRFKVVMKTGQLGWWQEIARACAARDEAERLIYGKVVSPALDPAEIVENRKKWQDISFSLNAGVTLSRQSQWVPAAEYFSKVLHDPVFDFDVTDMKNENTAQHMAALFVMAGDQANYRELVRRLVERKRESLTPSTQERYGQVFVCNTELLTPELRKQALTYARQICNDPELGNNIWARVLRGTMEYREGHYSEAIESLGLVFFSSPDSLPSARAKVFQALAMKRLGQNKEALETMQDANAIFAKSANQSGDWCNQIFYQIAMKELLAELVNTNEPAKER